MPLGGGILSIKAIELSPSLCTSSGSSDCKITKPQSEITNHIDFFAANNIEISAKIDTFINFGSITTAQSNNQAFTIKNANGYIGYFINYGIIKLDKMSFWVEENSLGIGAVTNYGEMGQIGYNANVMPLILNNFGIIGEKTGASISVKNNASVLIQNYALRITEDANTFSTSSNSSSHLVINDNSGQGSVRFRDGDSKIILDFGSGFEFGEKYLINKITVVDGNGKSYDNLGVDFSRLTVTSDIYLLSQRGDNFVVDFVPQYGIIGTIHKANVRTMNNFYLMSNAMIYPRKAQNLGKKNYRNIVDSANHLKSYETFLYRNETTNRRIQRQNKRNYSRESLKSQNLESSSLRADSQNLRGNPKDLQALRSNHPNNSLRDSANHNYYFILTPFINHNHFFESGCYNLRGFDYGFLTAFSARVAESNSLGTHFAISYGSLGDKKDKDLSIKSLNINVGLNYKLDLIWDMFIKARGDFYYFLNQAKTLTMIEAIKPNNLGFGASVSYGKDFNFGNGGVLGLEAGIDYKALQSSTISLHDNIYQKALYHLLYADLGLSYSKYFGNFGVNAGLGIKGNITANKLAKSQIRINNLNQSVDMVLDNDIFLGYANLGASYVLNAKDFDMEFSVAYYGNYGDRIISNAGGFEWRVGW